MNESKRREKFTDRFLPDTDDKGICVKCGTIKKRKVHYWRYYDYKSKCSDDTGRHEWRR